MVMYKEEKKPSYLGHFYAYLIRVFYQEDKFMQLYKTIIIISSLNNMHLCKGTICSCVKEILELLFAPDLYQCRKRRQCDILRTLK